MMMIKSKHCNNSYNIVVRVTNRCSADEFITRETNYEV